LRHENAKEVYNYLKEQILVTRTRTQEKYDIGVDELKEPLISSFIYTS